MGAGSVRTRRGRVLASALAVALLAVVSGGATAAQASPASRAVTVADQQPGLSSNSLTVANVSILSGPVPGLFLGAPYGVEAYFAYVNSKGGVDGRHLNVQSLDDGFSCSTNQSDTQSALSTAFAFVGSFSLYDNCGAKVLRSHPDVPDVSYSLDPTTKELSNNYSPQPAPTGFQTGPFIYMKKQYPRAVKAVGTLVGNVAYSEASWVRQRAAMQSVGYHVNYVAYVSPLQTDFTSYILRMRDAGVQFLYLTDEDAASIARILNAAEQQNWHPQVISTPVAYDASFMSQVNDSAAQGLLIPQVFAMYLGQDRSTTPAVSTFLNWMHKTHPNFAPDLYALYGWSSAQLFVQALQAAGPNPTQSSVLSALSNIHNFSANGLLAPADPGSKKPPTCWMLAKINNGRFVRVLPSKKGFTCSPSGYYYLR